MQMKLAVVIPPQIGASTTRILPIKLFFQKSCYTPSNRGFYNTIRLVVVLFVVFCCYTPSNRGFYNLVKVVNFSLSNLLLYPLK